MSKVIEVPVFVVVHGDEVSFVRLSQKSAKSLASEYNNAHVVPAVLTLDLEKEVSA